MVFRMLQNGARATCNGCDAPPNPATGKKEIWANFMGAPSVYFVWAVPQDGIATPPDFNASGPVTCGVSGTVPAGHGRHADRTGRERLLHRHADRGDIPDNAQMLTGGVGYSYNVRSTMPLTQTNLADYPTASDNSTTGRPGPRPAA